jgi:hypothetical protein
MQGLLPAIVFSTEDPLSLGRIQVECPLIAPGEILPHEEDNWIPVLESFVVTGKAGGSHSLLQKGNQVMLAPRFGSSQQAPSWVVVGCVHSTVDKLHPLLNRTKGTYGSVSPAGKIEINNDKEGSQIISHPNGATLQVSKEGNITNQTKGGARSHLGQDGELRIENEKSFTTHDPSGQVASGNAGGASSVLSSSGNVNVTASSGTALSLQSSGTLSGSGGSTGQALSKLEKASTKLQEAIKSSEVASKELPNDSSNLPNSSPKSSKDLPKIFQTIGESLEKIGNGSAESLGVPNLQEVANFLRYKLDVLKPQINVLLDTDLTLPEFPAQLSGLFTAQELTPEPATLDAIARTLANLRYNRKLQVNFLLSKLLGNDYAPETGILEQLELEPVMAQIAAIDPINPDAIATLQGLLPKKLQGIEHEILMRAIALPPAERIAALVGATRIQDAKAIHSQVSKDFPSFSKQTPKDSSNSSKDASNDSNPEFNSLETPPEEVVTQSAKEAQQKIQSFLGGIPKGSSAAKVVAGSSSSQLLAAGGASKVAAEPGTAYLQSPAGKLEAGGGGAGMSSGGGSVSATGGGVAMAGKKGEKVEISNNKLSMGGGGEGAIAIDKDDLILSGQGGATISLTNGKIAATADAINLIVTTGDSVSVGADGLLFQDSAKGKIQITKGAIAIQGGGDRVSVSKSIDIGQGGGTISINGTAINVTGTINATGTIASMGAIALASNDFKLTAGTDCKIQIDPSNIKLSYLDNALSISKDTFAIANILGTSKINSKTVEITGGDNSAHKFEVKAEGIYADGVNLTGAISAASTRLDTAESRVSTTESKIQVLENKTDLGKLEAQGISQFFLEAEGSTRNPNTKTTLVLNLFSIASPYPNRTGFTSYSPGGSASVSNDQRSIYSNVQTTDSRAATSQLAVLTGGLVKLIYDIAPTSPPNTAFNTNFALYKIYLVTGEEVSGTGTFSISGTRLTWTANSGSLVAQNTRVLTKLAIDYPATSGIGGSFATLDAAWVSNAAIAPANIRTLDQNLTAYEAPALGQDFILIYDAGTSSVFFFYKKISVTSSATGVITIPTTVKGCFAFIENRAGRVDAPVVTGLTANTAYNVLIYHAPAAAEYWQLQISYRPYQGTKDLAFLSGATIATNPRLYVHSQGGGSLIASSSGSLGGYAISDYISAVDAPPYSPYLFQGAIRETGDSTNNLATTFKQIGFNPSALFAFPVIGETITTVTRATNHQRSISNAIANAEGKLFAIKTPYVITPYFQFAFIFVAVKSGIAKLVIITQNCAATNLTADFVFDPALLIAIDTFPLQAITGV